MSEVELAAKMAAAIGQGIIVGVPVAQAVEVARKRIVGIDGWKVLVLSASLALAISAMFVVPASMSAALDWLRIGFFGALAASGTDGLLSKWASKSSVRQ